MKNRTALVLSPNERTGMIPETQLEPQSPDGDLARIEKKLDTQTSMIASLHAEVNTAQARVVDLEKVVLGLERRLEQQQIEVHELREQRATMGPGLPPLSSYAAAAVSAQGPLVPVGLSARNTPIRTEELFCTVGFSRVEHTEGTTAVDPAALRKKVEQKIQEQDEKFHVKVVTKDRRSPDYLSFYRLYNRAFRLLLYAALIALTMHLQFSLKGLWPSAI